MLAGKIYNYILPSLLMAALGYGTIRNNMQLTEVTDIIKSGVVAPGMYTRVDSIFSSMTMLGCDEYLAKCYAPAISHVCLYYKADWKWVIAKMRQESNFDPKAKSFVDTKMPEDKDREFAWGLMQIKPSTAKDIAKDLGEEYHRDLLFDGPTNIRWGVYYYSCKLIAYGYDVELATRAYNSGDWAVRHGKSSDKHWERVNNFYDLICKHTGA